MSNCDTCYVLPRTLGSPHFVSSFKHRTQDSIVSIPAIQTITLQLSLLLLPSNTQPPCLAPPASDFVTLLEVQSQTE